MISIPSFDPDKGYLFNVKTDVLVELCFDEEPTVHDLKVALLENMIGYLQSVWEVDRDYCADTYVDAELVDITSLL